MNKIMVCSECMSDIPLGSDFCPVCHHSFENMNPPAALPIGTVLSGRYTVGTFADHDGEGITYNAVDNLAHQYVTVKEFAPANLAKGRAASGFIIPASGEEVLFKTTRMDFADLYRELIKLAGTKGLQTVYDVLEENNTVYAVVEPQQNISLEGYLARRAKPLTTQEAIRLLTPVIHGVCEMHSVGLLHRGISTSTVYVNKDGTAWLGGYATLGLREVGSELKCELFDGYTAPEQYHVADFDGKYTDVYALGALFYRALSGISPVNADLRSQGDTLVPLKRIDPELPTYVSNAVSMAMRLDTRHRMQTADALLAAVMSTAGAEALEEKPKINRKFIMIAAAVAVVAVFAAVGILGTIMLSKSLQKPQPPLSSSVEPDASSGMTEELKMPNLRGKMYKDVAESTAYSYLLFTIESEYSNAFDEGVIISQDVTAGTVVQQGTVVHLVVSLGAETAEMPEVINHHIDDVCTQLNELGIQYSITTVKNDGTYIEGYVVSCDHSQGASITLHSDIVVLSVAGPAQPASSKPKPDSSSSEPQTPDDTDKDE